METQRSQMTGKTTTAVPVAISLNMSTFSIGMAVAAAVGGIVVDTWGALMLPLVGAPLVLVAMLVWRTVPESDLRPVLPDRHPGPTPEG